SCSAEAGGHLVQDEMHAKLAAQRLHSFDKAKGGSLHPGRSLDAGFNNDCTQFLMSLLHESLNFSSTEKTAGCYFLSEGTAITGGVKGFVALKQQRSIEPVEKINAPQAHSAERVSVVGVGEGSKFPFAAESSAHMAPILKGHL